MINRKIYAHSLRFVVCCDVWIPVDLPYILPDCLWPSSEAIKASKATQKHVGKCITWVHLGLVMKLQQRSTTQTCAYFTEYILYYRCNAYDRCHIRLWVSSSWTLIGHRGCGRTGLSWHSSIEHMTTMYQLGVLYWTPASVLCLKEYSHGFLMLIYMYP